MKHSRIFIFITIVLVAMFASGCCQKKATLPEKIDAMLDDSSGKVVRIGIYGDPMGLNPIAHLNIDHSRMVSSFVHASPIRKLADGSFEPYLFDSYWMSHGENGTLILEAVWKNNLKWHDGTDFDPRDLEFTFQQMQNDKVQSPYAELVKGVVSISSFGQGKRTRIVFASDSRRYFDLLTVGILPSHLLKDLEYSEPVMPSAFKSAEKEEAPASYTWAAYIDKPVGLGPYSIKERDKGSYLLLEPNPHFYDGAVASRPQVIVHSSFNYQQLITDFRSKRYDWINLPSMLAEQLELMKIDNIRLVRYPNSARLLWVFNNRRTPLDNTSFRLALDLVVDRSRIKNQFPADAALLYQNPLASASATPESHGERLARALKILDDAGIKDSNSDGIREVAGKPCEITILVNDDNLIRRVIADKIVEDLKYAGIKASVEAVSWAEFVGARLKTGNFDTALLSYQLPAAGNWVAFLHSSPAALDSLNFAGVSDEELDKALTKLDSVFVDDDTMVARATVSRYLEEHKPVSFLLQPYDLGMYHGETGSAIASSTVWNDVLNWRLLFGPENSKL
jgi:ABC-type transport system substrate-binding protein